MAPWRASTSGPSTHLSSLWFCNVKLEVGSTSRASVNRSARIPLPLRRLDDHVARPAEGQLEGLARTPPDQCLHLPRAVDRHVEAPRPGADGSGVDVGG